MPAGGLRIAKDVDHVDRAGNVGKPRVDVLAQNVLSGEAGLTGMTLKPFSVRYFNTKKHGRTSLGLAPTMAMVFTPAGCRG